MRRPTHRIPPHIAERYRREAAEDYAVTLEEHVVHDARSPRSQLATGALLLIAALLVLGWAQHSYGDENFVPRELR